MTFAFCSPILIYGDTMIMLTKKQHALLQFIKDFIEKYGYAPTYREIAQHFNLHSVATVHKHIKALAAREKIKKQYNHKRSLELVEPETILRVVELPLLGFIAAGKPIEAIQVDESFQLPESMVNGKEAYVLKVRGDSMIEEHIQDGDYVIIEKRNYAQNGEMIVALLHDSEVTLKRIYFENNKVRLQPGNPSLSPLIIEPDALQIQGIVIGIMRKYK